MEKTLAGVYLLYGHPQVLTLAQKLACRCLLQAEHLIVLDGANVFDPYLVSRLATKVGRVPTNFLRGIRISRSFTCHQMLSLVRQIKSAGKLWESPFILLLGPLTTFYDESVPHYEAWKLFRAFQRELNSLTAAGFRLLLSCQQPSAATKRDFVQQLKASARGIASCWEVELNASRFAGRLRASCKEVFTEGNNDFLLRPEGEFEAFAWPRGCFSPEASFTQSGEAR